MQSLRSFARHRRRSAGETLDKTPATATTETKGLILNLDWRHDVMVGFLDAFWFRGQVRELRQKTLALADIQPGDWVLDVGCGTGTLAMEAQRRVGDRGYVAGIDPGTEQIACARAKAARRHMPIEFQTGVIERLPFPDATFDVALSTLMMHHLPASTKRQGLAETARVLKPGGRLLIADFTRKQERAGRAARFHAGGSDVHDLTALVEDAGFQTLQTEEMKIRRFSAFPGAGIIRAYKS